MANKKDNYRSEDLDYEKIVSLGKAYLGFANKGNSNFRIKQIGWSYLFLVPYITNLAFSCELFLKAILKKGGKKIKTHILEQLFDELDDDIKKAIIELVNKNEPMINRKNPLDIFEERDKIFKNKLHDISNLFVRWRYIYECDPQDVEVSFLETFSYTLLSVIEES